MTTYPSEARDVDRGDGAGSGSLLRVAQQPGLERICRHDCEEDGDVEDGTELQANAGVERSSTAEEVDQEERAEIGRAELDDTQNAGREQLLRLSSLAQGCKELGGVDGDGARSGPLAQQLRHDAEHETISVGGDHDKLAELAPSRCAHGCLSFTLKLLANVQELVLNERVVFGKLSENAEVLEGLLVSALHGEPSRGLVDGEGEDEEESIVTLVVVFGFECG